MQNTRNLLVVIDPKHNDSPALKRAKQIADQTKAHLHLLIADKNHDHLALLDLLKEGLVESGYSVSTECAWHGSEHETIIHAQQAHNCGLVIKQHLPENPIKALLLTPEDWKLLRACPCPVLIAKHSRPWEGGVVLAAVDVGNTEPEHRQLHESIVDSGFNIASLIKGELHVVSAFPPPMLATVDAVYPIVTDYEASYRAACKEFQRTSDISDSHLHIEQGPPDVIIPLLAHKLNAVVTVLGTVARTGLSGALIGNTAESVIDAVETDVLVIKPQDRIQQLEAELNAKI